MIAKRQRHEEGQLLQSGNVSTPIKWMITITGQYVSIVRTPTEPVTDFDGAVYIL